MVEVGGLRAGSYAPTVQVGFAEGVSFDPDRPDWDSTGPRPLRWSAWYPTDEGPALRSSTDTWFRTEPAIPAAAAAPRRTPWPLVLLSHGTGGVTGGLGWLATRLARRGYVVLGVDHHGNTGSETYRAEGFLCLWERSLDISALLDDTSWRAALDAPMTDHAYIAGFSAGAYTAMLLLGARVAYSQFESGNPEQSPTSGPREYPDLADHIPGLLHTNPAFAAAWERRTASYRDHRIAAGLVLAPGRSVRGFDPGSLATISRPVGIAVGGEDSIAPLTDCSRWLHQRLPESRLHIVHPDAGHYVFLPEPTGLGLEQSPEVFTDPPGVIRSAVHDTVADIACRLFA